MKNMIKMSLVAAVAVAGLSSNVAAKPLEEAIKNVDVSGYIRLRFDGNHPDNSDDSTTTDFDTQLILKSKISDRSTAIVKVEADKSDDSSEESSSKLNAELTMAYLSTKFDAATVNVGRMAIPGPFDDTAYADGVLGTVPVGPVTLAGAFFTNTSSTVATAKDAYALALMGNSDMISYDLWYMKAANTISLVSAHVAADVSGFNIDARYTEGSLDQDNGMDDASLAKLFVSGSFDMIDFRVGAAITGDDNSSANIISVDGETDTDANIEMHELNVGEYADATAFVAGISTTFSDLTLGLDYLTVDYDNSDDADELDFTASYKLDTNLKVTGIYAIVDDEDANNGEYDSTRIEVKYSF